MTAGFLVSIINSGVAVTWTMWARRMDRGPAIGMMILALAHIGLAIVWAKAGWGQGSFF